MPSEKMVERLAGVVYDALPSIGCSRSETAVDFVLVSLTDEDIAALAAERGMVVSRSFAEGQQAGEKIAERLSEGRTVWGNVAGRGEEDQGDVR